MEPLFTRTPIDVHFGGGAPQLEMGGSALSLELSAPTGAELALNSPKVELDTASAAPQLTLTQLSVEIRLP